MSGLRWSLRIGLALVAIVAAGCKGEGGNGNVPAPTYAIKGTVSGAYIAGVTVTLGGPVIATTTTDEAGAYEFRSVPNGAYTITPTLAGYTFTPPSTSVTVSGADPAPVQPVAAASAIPSSSISGTVTYGGAKTGRIYVQAWSVTSAGAVLRGGTSLAGPGPFTIRGMRAGDYGLYAWMDTLGLGEDGNAGDPFCIATGITVSEGGSAIGAVVALADPAPPAAVAPTRLEAHPGQGVLLVDWEPAWRSNFPGLLPELETATSYDLSWGTDVDATNRGAVVVDAQDDGYLLASVTDGEALYLKIRARVGDTASPWSPVIGPVIVGPVAGGNTISGSVTFPGTATGPLYVVVEDLVREGNGRLVVIPSPTSPAPFSVSGVGDGPQVIHVLLDQDGSHIGDDGDLVAIGDDGGAGVDVTGSMSGLELVLASPGGAAHARTVHVAPPAGAESYGLNLGVRGRGRRPVAVALTSGKGLPLPLDLAPPDFEIAADLGASRPSVGDAYAFAVQYADGSTETLSSSVTAVLDAFPTNLSETTSAPHAPGAPLFTWTSPAAPPASYGYRVQLTRGGSEIWTFPDRAQPLPSRMTTLAYDLDGEVGGPMLPGEYTWSVSLVDPGGNAATTLATYVVPAAGP